MRIVGEGTETFLYLNGIEVSRPVRIDEFTELLPASCSPDIETIITAFQSQVDLGIAIIFLPLVRSQLRVVAETPRETAFRAWNTIWNAVLLSALFDCEVVCNFQSDSPAENFDAKSNLRVTNYQLRGLTAEHRILDEKELDWIEKNFSKAHRLLEVAEFRNAIHSLATYRWHSLPRAQLALIWSGIEGLFQIHSEIVFRLSLYIARFLSPTDEDERKQIFSRVKNLYKYRSVAVHGSVRRGALNTYVDESASLLRRLVYKCIETEDIPHPDSLAP